MKKLNLLLGIFALCCLSLTACDDNDSKQIEFSSLPASSRSFIESHFDPTTISYVKEERNHYEVNIGSIEVEFNRSGEWRKIELNGKELPQSIAQILNQNILSYISTHYQGYHIEEIEKKNINNALFFKAEVERGDSDFELLFNSSGKIVSIDGKPASGSGGEEIDIDNNEVKNIKVFINEHFPATNINRIEKNVTEAEFEVELYVNGREAYELEFDLDENIKSIDAEDGFSIPLSVMLPSISEYVSINYEQAITNNLVESYSKLEGFAAIGNLVNGWKVEIDGRPEINLYFSQTGEFVKKIEDYD